MHTLETPDLQKCVVKVMKVLYSKGITKETNSLSIMVLIIF